MNRREAIERTALLLGYAVSAPAIMGVLKGCKPAPELNYKPVFLNEPQALTIGEIAERLQISENTVEQHLTKAARRCAQVLFESPQTAREDNGMFAKLRRRMKLHDKNTG